MSLRSLRSFPLVDIVCIKLNPSLKLFQHVCFLVNYEPKIPIFHAKSMETSLEPDLGQEQPKQ